MSSATVAADSTSYRLSVSRRSIPLIFDEVFMGFRLARGGAQEYFGVRADLVTYGKSLGGGLPVGVLCGRREYMKRFRDDRPADVCFARGTFNSHPYVMAAMNEFLLVLDTPEVQRLYDGLDDTWDGRAARLNLRLAEEGLPVRVENVSSSGPSSTHSPLGTTGCSSTTCAPPGCTCPGSAPGG